MPSSEGQRGRPFRDHRQVIEGIVYRLRTGLAWRDLPESFGPWQTIWKRHKRFSADGTWDKIHAHLVAEADAAEVPTQAMGIRPGDTSLCMTGVTRDGKSFLGCDGIRQVPRG